MRLTNVLREDFLDSVMSSLPWKNLITDKLAVDEMERRAFAALPDDVRPLHKKYPGLVDSHNQLAQGFPRDYVFKKDAYRRWYFTCPRIVEAETLDFKNILIEVLARDQEEVIRHNLRLNLRGVAYHATTLAELQAALPDLISYMPVPVVKVKTMAVAPIGLMSQLKRAGLKVPKGVTA